MGNRASRTITDTAGTLVETYTYDTASNRLLSMTDGTTVQSFSYGASGQITGDDRGAGSDLGFVYDGSDRLVRLQSTGVPDTDYRHNAFGERVVKEDLGAAETTHFHYDRHGMLLAESDDLGSTIRSYIYLEGMPIAQIEPTGVGGAPEIAYLHSDHLGTPQAMTDAGVQLLWWRDQTPFGQTVASGGLGSSPLRFPGQFADAESGLAYNYFRDYDPALGRYIQSDPIGLAGGLNTYGYVGGNPLNLVDPLGTSPIGSLCRRFPQFCFGPNTGDNGGDGGPPANDNDECEVDCENWFIDLTGMYLQIITMKTRGKDTSLLERQYEENARLFCQVCPSYCKRLQRF